jgi:hypothetical protein
VVIKGRYFYILLLAIALSACATDDHTDGLLLNYSAIDNSRSFKTLFNLDEKFIIELPKQSWEYHLHVKKGIFRSKYVTDKGILYQGGDACIMSIHTDDYTLTYDGGFFVPFDMHDPVRIWYDISTKDARDRNGLKIMDRYTLPDTRSTSRAIMGPRSTGVILSQPISTENDRMIRNLSDGH